MNKEKAIKLVKTDPDKLESLSGELRNDFDVAKAALSTHGSSYCYIGDDLRDNKELIMEALKTYKRNLEYTALNDDKEVCLSAVSGAGSELQFCSNALKSDKDLVLAAVKDDGFALAHANSEMTADRDVVMAAVETASGGFEFAADSLKEDRDFCLEVVGVDGGALEYMPEKMLSDKEIVLTALNNDSFVAYSVDLPDEIKNDPEISAIMD
jgi:hypothetical protein